MTQHSDLVIVTPGHSMTAEYVKSLIATIYELSKNGISWAFSNAYASHVANAREVSLNGDFDCSLIETRPFKGNMSYKKILWIDSDISWNPEDVIKLYSSDKDIISGAYLLGNGQVTAYPKLLEAPLTFEDVKNATDLIKIEAAGFGFICVKQGVFESLSRPWFQSVPITKMDSETNENFTFPIMGEDISWSKRVLDQGFEMWLDPTVQVQHHKTMKLTWEGIRP